MSAVIPCQQSTELKKTINKFAEVLRTEAHKLGDHGLPEAEFYLTGILQGAVERLRGQQSATMQPKRDFIARVLRYMQDAKVIEEWESAGSNNRYDYTVKMPGGRLVVIEAKGCLDGNNTTIAERPAHAQEFIIWSLCTNPSSSPRKNVWSGIHTRLGVEMIAAGKHIDGLIVWDWLCGSKSRPCPKMNRIAGEPRLVTVGQFQLPPPCIYLFPKSVPTVRDNANPDPHALKDVTFLDALNTCFGGFYDEINSVRLKVDYKGKDTVRTTSVERGGQLQQASKATAIRRK